MASLAFDTLAAARRLKKVGMEESHAEAVAENLRDAVTGSVATKQDPGAAKLELREGIAAVKARLREEIAGGQGGDQGDQMALGDPRRADVHAGRADVRNPLVVRN